MLRISKLTDYGTVILACLAVAAGPAVDRRRGRRAHARRPADRQQAAEEAAAQRPGDLDARQPRRLSARAPAGEISAARILDALEGPFAITECSGQHSNCGIESNCRVGHAWQRVNGAIRRALTDITLAQLAGIERGSSTTVPLTRLARASHE